MGTIGEEELIKWEKMQVQGMGNGSEEKIFVSVRLRPLSEKEAIKNEVSDWECLNESTILYRNTLQERAGLPTAYSFDRVFRGDCLTREVYDEGAKNIALSVVTGINSTIFAYGQTSSGKTYTMNGVTEYTVADIYDYIQRHEERAFVLKFSAIEIYNEVVRDLLSTDNASLRLLDDPERGTFVEKLTEETLRDENHLKELLSICEAQRQVGETCLNETSSRSHQILRLTIESSAREFLGKDKSTTLAASVNFVDLAGSERASQALSNGQRLKEGCHINRSLLTLGTVIRKLSKGRQGHINYRDSKLTRILQHSLGGNARTAIICTLSPSRTHVEQSRNTLLFASCAKEVATNAHVNVVMSDKALVKHLQKELARLESEIRYTGPTIDYSAILRKKDLQIEKLEKDVKEVTKQRDLAQSRVEELLKMVLDDSQGSKQGEVRDSNSERKDEGIFANFERKDDECSVSESLDSDDTSCKEVRCIEIDEVAYVADSEVLQTQTRPENSVENGFTQGFESIVTPEHDELSFSAFLTDLSSKRSVKLSRSQSCKATLMSNSINNEMEELIETTLPNCSQRIYPGRPERKQWNLPEDIMFSENSLSLSRNNSELSKIRNNGSIDEDIPSVDAFFAGLKEMAKLQYDEVHETESKVEKNVKSIGLDAMPEDSNDWPIEFEKMQRVILQLWHTCNVSLIHRTYFFMLFKGDPMDSIYMEVELRRLSYLKETFLKGNSVVQNGSTLTLGSSVKALRREREMLSRLMYKRFSSDERNKVYQNWGISLNSKQRKFQLVSLLWSDVNNMDNVRKSAEIVGKLIRFSEQGKADKEMFGLSFTPPRSIRRSSFGWKNSMSLL